MANGTTTSTSTTSTTSTTTTTTPTSPPALKTGKKRMYSTVLDVIRKAPLIMTNNLDLLKNDPDYADKVLTDGEIENFIIEADGIILSFLVKIYGGESGLRTTAWAKTPFAKKDNNEGGSELMSVSLNNTSNVYTAYWIIEMLSSTTFSLWSSLEGGQGRGNIQKTFYSTNSEIGIPWQAWKSKGSGFAKEDKFYFSIINVYPIINEISCSLAAGNILQQKYSESIPNANEYANNLKTSAMNLLDKLSDPDNPLTLTSVVDDISSTSIDYRIGALGEDQSTYLTDNDLDL